MTTVLQVIFAILALAVGHSLAVQGLITARASVKAGAFYHS